MSAVNPRGPRARGAIWKFELQPQNDSQLIGEGLSLKPLSVAWCAGSLFLWAEAREPQCFGKPRPGSTGLQIVVTLTGQDVPADGQFIGSAHNGPISALSPSGMVVHVYAVDR